MTETSLTDSWHSLLGGRHCGHSGENIFAVIFISFVLVLYLWTSERKKDGMTVILTMWKENMVHGSFGRSYDPHLLITRIWQERSEVYFLANSVTRFHCSAVKWYTSCLNLWLCLDFSGFHQNCPPRRFVTIELLKPPTSATYQNSFSYLKVPEKRGKPISCWCNHTPFDCHNFGACFYLDMT